jgi:N-acyl homoserine lactone hydrolase
VKLTVLFLGRCDVDQGALLSPGVGDGEHIFIPIPAFLVETDDGKRVLIDTGMHPVHIDDPDHTFREMPGLPEILRPAMTREDTLEHRLGELGLGVGGITHVVNSHLHFDHCGQNYLFTQVPILVNRRHYDAALVEPAFPNEYFEIPGLHYEFHDEEEELFQGIRTIQSPGHAPFHQSFLLDLPNSGKILLCIDAVYLQANLDHDTWDSMADPDAARESAQKLRRLAEKENALMVYGHDPGQWETLRRAPAYYD